MVSLFLVGVNAEFLIASAETFSRPEEFDVTSAPFITWRIQCSLCGPVSTIYGPVVTLRWRLRFTIIPRMQIICYFMHMQNNDATNFWALSRSALTKCLELVGFREIRQLRMIVPVQGLSLHAHDADQLNRPGSRKDHPCGLMLSKI
jgi:hypothetical protein